MALGSAFGHVVENGDVFKSAQEYTNKENVPYEDPNVLGPYSSVLACIRSICTWYLFLLCRLPEWSISDPFAHGLCPLGRQHGAEYTVLMLI